jgi:hypothetical protein
MCPLNLMPLLVLDHSDYIAVIFQCLLSLENQTFSLPIVLLTHLLALERLYGAILVPKWKQPVNKVH